MKRGKLKWEDPGPMPPRGGRRQQYITNAVLEQLKRHPGKWALIEEARNEKTARANKYRWVKRFTELEITSREKKVYARFVGRRSARSVRK